MKTSDSGVYEILSAFSKSEFAEFGRYLRSPYYNSRSEVVRYFNALKKYYPKFSSKALTKENLFSEVYPNKKYSDILMRKLISLTINHAVNFIGVKAAEENKLEFSIKVLDKLREKKLNRQFDKKEKAVLELFRKGPHTFDKYEQKFQYTTIKNGYLLNKNEKEMVHHFQLEIDHLMEYFLSIALLLYIRLSEWQVTYNVKFDLVLHDEVIKLVSSGKYNDSLLVSLYYNMYMLLTAGEEKYYFTLAELRKKYAANMSAIDDYNTTIVMIQYCYKRVQAGDMPFRRHQFDTTKIILEKGYNPPGFVDPYFFVNSARNSAQIEEFGWCENFIAEYGPRLNPETSAEMVNYAYAMLEFYRGSFDSALGYLSKTNPELLNMKLDMKNMQMMIYYELGYWSELESYIDSYRHYLSREVEVSASEKSRNADFIKLFSQLVNYRVKNDIESAVMFMYKLNKKPYFKYKEWIMQKAAKIK